MRYLCLISLDEKELDAPPAAEINALNAPKEDDHSHGAPGGGMGGMGGMDR